MEQIRLELGRLHDKLEEVRDILWEGANDEQKEVVDMGLQKVWLREWDEMGQLADVRGLEEENDLFRRFLKENTDDPIRSGDEGSVSAEQGEVAGEGEVEQRVGTTCQVRWQVKRMWVWRKCAGFPCKVWKNCL